MWQCKVCSRMPIANVYVERSFKFTPDKDGNPCYSLDILSAKDLILATSSGKVSYFCPKCGIESKEIKEIADWRPV